MIGITQQIKKARKDLFNSQKMGAPDRMNVKVVSLEKSEMRMLLIYLKLKNFFETNG